MGKPRESVGKCRTTVSFSNKEELRQAKAVASLKGMTLSEWVAHVVKEATSAEWKKRMPQGYVPVDWLPDEIETGKSSSRGKKRR